jgi:uncharacterized protein (TIGR01319 family)
MNTPEYSPVIRSADVGSTWTKGALFAIRGGVLTCLCRKQVPTTPEDLTIGFHHLMDLLQNAAKLTGKPSLPGDVHSLPLYWSSSAKGGLAIAVSGIVPGLTAKAAGLAAASAGGVITSHYSYRLTGEQIRDIEKSSPDIVLIAGGTDGGDTGYVLHNAGMLAAAKVSFTVLYAGNKDAADSVCKIFQNRRIRVAENILPDLETLNIGPCKDAIRREFLDQIVRGKGLDAVTAEEKSSPSPTPESVYRLLCTASRITAASRFFEDFLLCDIGGATTDIYSSVKETAVPGRIVKGLTLEGVLRTVEGDLGTRKNAASVPDMLNTLNGPDSEGTADAQDLLKWAGCVKEQPQRLPGSLAEQKAERTLTSACFAGALMRHAGTVNMVPTLQGDIEVQEGRDLSNIKHVLFSGGYPQSHENLNELYKRGLRLAWLLHLTNEGIDRNCSRKLYPGSPQVIGDRSGLIPLFANCVSAYPEETVKGAAQYLNILTNQPLSKLDTFESGSNEL